MNFDPDKAVWSKDCFVSYMQAVQDLGEQFTPEDFWSLFNALTEACKDVPPCQDAKAALIRLIEKL